MSPKILSVFGANGSGKSLISLLLAENLSNQKKNICIVSFDKLTPMLNVYLPFMKLDTNNSVAKILTDDITYDNLKKRIHSSTTNKYISFLALATFDNALKYPEDFKDYKMSELVNLLSKFEIDYFIFDLPSNLYNDSLIMYILKSSDKVIYTLNPTTTSVSFLDSNQLYDIDEDKITFVLNNCYKYSPTDTFMKERKINHVVMHQRELYESFLQGDFSKVNQYFSFIDEVV